MENLFFSLNATVPVFLMMVLGLILHKIGWIDDEFASKMNQFVFRVPLPLLLFGDLARVDFGIGRYRENSFRLPTEAARRFLELHLSRIFTARRGWRPL